MRLFTKKCHRSAAVASGQQCLFVSGMMLKFNRFELFNKMPFHIHQPATILTSDGSILFLHPIAHRGPTTTNPQVLKLNAIIRRRGPEKKNKCNYIRCIQHNLLSSTLARPHQYTGQLGWAGGTGHCNAVFPLFYRLSLCTLTRVCVGV